jgi:hypothetical protein
VLIDWIDRAQAWALDAHENGPRCAQISGPTVGARQRSPAVDLLVANEGLGDSPLSRPQPPEAVAEGQSLQGTITRATLGQPTAHVGVCPREDAQGRHARAHQVGGSEK